MQLFLACTLTNLLHFKRITLFLMVKFQLKGTAQTPYIQPVNDS